jgi:murein DD-endopeptidase MepM/ murein hydrolase activator NlpD
VVVFLASATAFAWYTGAFGALVSRTGVGPAQPVPLGSGRITSRYGDRENPKKPGERQFHTGVDLGVPIGTPIFACEAGRVVYLLQTEKNGLAVFVQTPTGRRWCYLHLSAAAVRLGQEVARGEQVAWSGDTGNVTGPHLHLQVYEGDNGRTTATTIDPAPLFVGGLAP